MGSVSQQQLKRCGRLWLVVLGVTSMSGCVLLDRWDRKDKPPQGTPCQIATTWQPELVHGVDFANHGTKRLAIMGRLYLFGKEVGTPMACEGTLTVQMFDLSRCEEPFARAVPNAGVSPPPLVKVWQYDPKTLEQMMQRDAIGWMYPIPLVWEDYNPAITRVQLKSVFQPREGLPLYSESGAITLTTTDPVAGVVQTSHIVGKGNEHPVGKAASPPPPQVAAAIRALQQGGGVQPPTIPPHGPVTSPSTIPPDVTARNQFPPTAGNAGSPPPDVTAAIRTLLPHNPQAGAGFNHQQWTTPSQPSANMLAPYGGQR